MEQKKIIMVAISVGVFLVIAIGAAILVFGAENNAPAVATARIIPAGSSMYPGYSFPDEYSQPVSNGNEPHETQPDESSGTESENAAITQSSDPDDSQSSGGITVANGSNYSDITINDNSSTVISVARPSTTAVPDVAPVTRQTSQPQTTARTTPPASTQNTSAPAAGSSSSSVSTAVPAAATARSTARTTDNFWVQAGSFSTVGRAEGVKDTLASKGITSIIENRVVDGTTYYRVRIGPYTTRNDAEYWLALIQSINGFESSQIWQTPVVQ